MTTVLELARIVRKLQQRAATPAPSVALLFAAEVDRLYRLREGTAHQAADAGIVRSVKRRRGGRGRWCYLITPADAAAKWGPQ